MEPIDDVLERIGTFTRSGDYALELDTSVRGKFDELWQAARHADEDY